VYNKTRVVSNYPTCHNRLIQNIRTTDVFKDVSKEYIVEISGPQGGEYEDGCILLSCAM
jgi:hypothetical protein